jgi:hypothetical protein
MKVFAAALIFVIVACLLLGFDDLLLASRNRTGTTVITGNPAGEPATATHLVSGKRSALVPLPPGITGPNPFTDSANANPRSVVFLPRHPVFFDETVVSGGEAPPLSGGVTAPASSSYGGQGGAGPGLALVPGGGGSTPPTSSPVTEVATAPANTPAADTPSAAIGEPDTWMLLACACALIFPYLQSTSRN